MPTSKNPYSLFLNWLAKTRLGGWLVLNVFTNIDKFLMKYTNGLLSTAIGSNLWKNGVLLTTTGAKSGKIRDIPLIATKIPEGYILIASATGHPRNPAWYYNLKANPGCTLRTQGKKLSCTAEEITDDRREQYWQAALDQYDGYDTYKTRTDRVIPVMLLRVDG